MSAALLGALAVTLADQGGISLLKGEESRLSYGLPGTPEGARRHAFFRVVCELAREMLRKEDAFLVENRRWIESLDPARRESEPGKVNKESSKRSPQWHAQLFAKFCQPAFDRLSAILHAANETKFFLALDECTLLGSPQSEDHGPSRKCSLIAFQRILKAAEHMTTPVSFWFLTLDTTSSASDMTPQGPHAPSRRLTTELKPLPPFTALDFNQFKDRLQRLTASSSLDIDNLKYLGRPVCPIFLFCVLEHYAETWLS